VADDSRANQIAEGKGVSRYRSGETSGKLTSGPFGYAFSLRFARHPTTKGSRGDEPEYTGRLGLLISFP